MKRFRQNDTDRRAWVQSDEGLFNLYRQSPLDMEQWVKANRAMIDQAAQAVLNGQKLAHFLAYDHGQKCACKHCKLERGEA